MSSDPKRRTRARQAHSGIGIVLGTALVLGGCGSRYVDPISLDAGAAGHGGNPSQGGGPGGMGNPIGTGGNPIGTGGNPGSGGGTGGSAAGGGGAGGVSPGTLSRVELAGSPIYSRLQRLTNAQWQRATMDILNLNAATDLSPGLPDPAAVAVTDFLNNEKLLFVDAQTEQGLETAAEAAAALVTGSADGLARIYAGTDAAGFVLALGRRAFRRPLSADDEVRYQAIFARGQELYGPTFANGAGLVIRAMLQSTPFLYRSELGLAGAPLDGYEVASKLSFWLAGTTPSDQLLDVAEAGGLQSVDDIESAARDLLESAGAVAVMRDFHQQLYGLPLATAPARPDVSPALGLELADVSTRFFDDIFTGGQGLREILTSTRYFVGPGLASSYGLSSQPTAIEERELDASRVGYFMQAPFLILNRLGDEADSIGRGNAILRHLLCVDLPDHSPPLSLPTLAPGQTNRQNIEQATSGTCASCHVTSIDALGFAFEGFDGLGRARTTDNGAVVVTSGSFPLQDGILTFANAKELMTSMATGTQSHTCYAKKLVGYALQRDMVEEDRPLLDAMAAVSRGHSLKELVVALVRDPAFRTRSGSAP